MKRYFLNQRSGSDLLIDDEGETFASLDDARAEATLAIREAISQSALLGFIDLDWSFEIRDAAGSLVGTIFYRDAIMKSAAALCGSEPGKRWHARFPMPWRFRLRRFVATLSKRVLTCGRLGCLAQKLDAFALAQNGGSAGSQIEVKISSMGKY